MRWGIESEIIGKFGQEVIFPDPFSPDNKTIAVPEKFTHEAKTPPLSTSVMICPSPVETTPPPKLKTVPESIGSGKDHVHSS
jgi:hypothetical protein